MPVTLEQWVWFWFFAGGAVGGWILLIVAVAEMLNTAILKFLLRHERNDANA